MNDVVGSPEFEKWWGENWGQSGADEEHFHKDSFLECWREAQRLLESEWESVARKRSRQYFEARGAWQICSDECEKMLDAIREREVEND